MARKRRDILRSKLDQLAEQIAADALDPGADLSHTQKVNTLKVVGAYWALSTKADPKKADDNAWEGYASRILGNGKDHHAEEDEP